MKTLIKALLITFLLIGSSLAPTYGQDSDDPPPIPAFPEKDLRFQHLTTEDGLSEGRVWGITQDRRGFMWFTSWDGVNRYDGYEFKVYKEEFGNPNSPGGTGFWGIHEDREGMIWVASHTGGGLSRFDPTTEQWRRYQHDPDDPNSLSSNNVITIHEDRTGTLWIATESGGLNRFEGETEAGVARFTRYPSAPEDPPGLSSDPIPNIYEDQSGELWFASFGGLYRYNLETETFTHYRHDPEDPNSLSSNGVFTIFEDHMGVLWVGTSGGGLNRFNPETETFVGYRHDPKDSHSLSGDVISSILEDGSGTLWIGTQDGGLNRYNRETDSFVSFQHDSSDTRSLGNNTVTALFEDQSGILWIGTAGAGIDRLNPSGQGFKWIRHDPANSNSLSNNDIRTVFEDQAGDLWIGTWDALNHYDPETETFTTYLHDPDDPNSLSNNRVWAVLEDRKGVLWIGTNGGGLNRLDLAAEDGSANHFKHFKPDSADPQSLSHGSVTALYEDRSDILWVGTWAGGLNALEPQTDEGQARFKSYQHDPEDPHSFGVGVVWSIHEDPVGNLWVGTQGGGLCLFDKESETFDCYLHNPEDEHSLSSNTVWAIHPDGEGYLWLGTSAGLNRFSPETGQFIQYTTADGLPHDTVVGILEDDTSQDGGAGDLWLSTQGGLSRFDPQSGSFHNYGAGDGLQGENFHQGAAHKTSEGKMLFAGQHGLVAFYPEDIQENPNIPPVHVTSFALSNEPVLIGGESPLQKSIIETEQLELSYDERVISFKFAALNYASPEKNRYRYKLEGFDEAWTEVGSDRRFVTYTNLNPGKYAFKVIGSNNDGVWNEEGASIWITITPPWWGTWWFRGGMLLLLVGLVAGGFVWQRDSARKREDHLEATVAKRTQELIFAEDQIRSLFATSQIGIGLTTIEGKILAANDTLLRMMGYSKEEFLGQNVTNFYVHPENRFELLEQLSKSKSVNNFGVRLRTNYDSEFFANMNVSQVIRGEETVIVAMIEDVTEQIQVNQQLHKEITERKHIEKELQTQISLLDGLLDAAKETIEIFDANTMEYLKWNKTFNQVTGYSDEEIAIMNPVSDFIEESDLPRAEAAMEELLRTGNAKARLIQVNKDGSLIPFEYTGAVTHDVDGNPLYGIIIGRDITERKQADEQLHFQAKLLEAVEQAVVVTDLGGHVVYWNPFAEWLYGWSADEALGRVTNELMMNYGANQQLDDELTALLLSGQSWTGEYSASHRDGTLLSVEATITPITNEAGDPIYAIGVSTDISERKRAEQALQASEKAYRSLVEKISDVVYTIDMDGMITYLNPAIETLIGLPPEKVVGQPFDQFIHPEDLGQMQNNVQILLSSTTPDLIEYRVLTNSGETRWIRVSSQPIMDGDQMTGLQGVLTDITDRKRNESQLKESATAAERDRLARGLHDSVTQSLYSINLQTDATLMAISSGNNEKAEHRLQVLKEITQEAMNEMRLLIFQLHPSVIEEEGLAVALQQRLNAVEIRAGITANFMLEGERRLPIEIETSLFQVAQEGLNNMLKHSRASEVLVRLSFESDSCRLTIRDDGVGFDPISAERSGSYGLAIMRERLAKINGSLTIDSQPGKGTILDIEVRL